MRRIVVVAVLLLAAALRFHDLGGQSLWHDEGNSYVQATRDFAAIADNAARDIHPPGYYWLLAVWRGLAGETEFALRFISALAGIITVTLTYALGKRLYGLGWAAALFVALNTFSIYYAQEARMYALLALWSAASMWAFMHLLRKGGWRWTVTLGLVNAAGLYTHYAFPFVLLAQGVLWVVTVSFRARYIAPLQFTTTGAMHRVSAYLAANLLALVIFLPWLPTAWDQVTNWPNTGTTLPIMEAVGTILAYLAFGITVGTGTTITVVFFLLFGLLHLPRDRVFNTLMPVIWVIVPVGLFLALGLFREANLKFLLPAQVGFALWMGRGVAVLWHIEPRRTAPLLRLAPKAAAAAGTLAMIAMLAAELNPLYTDYRRDDYRGIVQRIESSSRSGDAIILAAPNQQEVFGYYYDGDLPVYPLPRGLGGDDTATLAETRQIIAEHDRIFAVLWGLGERDPNNIVERTLDSEAFEADSQWYGNVRLVRYATPAEFDTVGDASVTFGDHITLETYALNGDTFAPGDVLQLRLAWSTDAPLDTRYKVFVQLLDPDGVLVAQRDAEPGGGLQTTTIWSPGEIVYDNHALIMPDDLLPSHYDLIIGLYNADVRLTLENNANFLTLAEITINQEH